jgi:hypothetical protein
MAPCRLQKTHGTHGPFRGDGATTAGPAQPAPAGYFPPRAKSALCIANKIAARPRSGPCGVRPTVRSGEPVAARPANGAGDYLKENFMSPFDTDDYDAIGKVSQTEKAIEALRVDYREELTQESHQEVTHL